MRIVLALLIACSLLSAGDQPAPALDTIQPQDSAAALADSILAEEATDVPTALLDTLDTPPSDSAAAEPEDTTFRMPHKALTFTLGFEVGASPYLEKWINGIKHEKTELEKQLSEAEGKIKLTNDWQQQPTSQAVLFPFSLGLHRQLDSSRSLSLRGNYSFVRKRSVYRIVRPVDTVTLARSEQLFRQQRAAVEIGYEKLFESRYFSIDKRKQAGYRLSVGAIPYARISVNNRKSMGRGALWGISLFADRYSATEHVLRSEFFYRGVYEGGFETVNRFISGSASSQLSHSFGLQITLLKASKHATNQVNPL